MKAELKKFTKKSLRRLKNSLLDFAVKGQLEQLHKSRIEIKKIKTVLVLANENDKNFKLRKTYLPFRNIFRKCAAIREPQVIEELASSNRVKKYIPHQSKLREISTLKKKVNELVKTIETKEEIILSGINSIGEKWFMKYLRKKSDFLKNILYPNLNLRGIHRIRKLLKEVYYLETILSNNKKYLKFLRNSSSIAGDWHDHQILITKIRKKASEQALNRLKMANSERIIKLRNQIAEYYME